MLGWALTFFLVAPIAAYLGFFALAGLAATIAKIVFALLLILLIVGALRDALRGVLPI